MRSSGAVQIDLVLLGGGHAQVAVLKSFAMKPIPGLRLTLVTDVLLTPYSGMLPAYVEGVWKHADMHIDLVKLAEKAGARLIHASCTGLNPDKQQLYFQDRPALGYDVLSINTGAAPALSEIKGAQAFGIPVKPISGFLNQLAATKPPNGPIALIGGGAASVELGLAMRTYFNAQHNVQPDISIISKSDRLLPHFPKKAHRVSLKALEAAQIQTHLGVTADTIDAANIHLSDGTKLPADLKFLVTPAKAPDWLKHTGLLLDTQGYITVKSTLQTPNYETIFAAGDIASIDGHPREKAGVYAVRSGPSLSYNLRAFITGKSLRAHRPQKRYLALLGLADGTAMAVRGNIVLRSQLFFWLKKWIDKRFIEKFTNLPEMLVEEVPPLALAVQQSDKTDPVFHSMRCLGCGAKTGPENLRQALSKACEAAETLGADPAFLPDIDSLSDSANFEIEFPNAKPEILQSVDSLSQMIKDPFIFGRIAALHALSDIFVAGGRPVTALAQIQLSFARQEIQKDTLVNILTGALLEFSKAKVKLIGGHTSEGHGTSCGFSIVGVALKKPEISSSATHQLLLSKPLGTGIMLAAHMRGQIGGNSYQNLIQTMLQSNEAAARILRDFDGAYMTDVTGFGLARHCASLLNQTSFSGAEIWVNALPIVSGVETLLNKQIRSSLHDLNAQNLPIDMRSSNHRQKLLYDPQTSGGILCFIPEHRSAACIKALQDAGYGEASVIGRTSAANGLLIYEDEMDL